MALTQTQFNTAISDWFGGQTKPYGEISTWNTSNVTDMTSTFQSKTFDGNISNWDTGSVTDMKKMFEGSSFTGSSGSIGGWNVANVTNMHKMFFWSTSFSDDLSLWNVDKVGAVTPASGEGFDDMFNSAFAMTTAYGSRNGYQNTPTANFFIVAPITDKTMLAAAISEVQSPTSPNTAYTKYGNPNAWDITAVIDMSAIFSGNTSWNEDVSTWAVGAVTNMKDMFKGAIGFNQDLLTTVGARGGLARSYMPDAHANWL